MSRKDEMLALLQWFPALANDPNFKITSSCTRDYNCIAWALGSSRIWYWPLLGNPKSEPDEYWPKGVDDDTRVESFLKAFEIEGYTPCSDGSLEPGFIKVVLFAKDGEATHACRQLPNGLWTSKMGPLNDIQHSNPSDLEGDFYGKVCCYMKKPL